MGCETAWTQLKGLDVNAQIALVLVGLLLVMLSSKLMEELCFSFLRLLEGYWRTPLAWLAEPLRRWQWRRIEKGRNRWNELMARREKGPLAYAEARELARRALQFKTERGRLPDINAADAWEKRMAEGVAALARYRAQARAAAEQQGAGNNG